MGNRIYLVVIGVLLAAVAYLLYKYNDQSRIANELRMIVTESQHNTPPPTTAKRDTIFITKIVKGKPEIIKETVTEYVDRPHVFAAVYDTVTVDSTLGLTVKVSFSTADTAFGVEPFVWYKCPEVIADRNEVPGARCAGSDSLRESETAWYERPAAVGAVGMLLGILLKTIF